jgi:hypothetical protein
MELFSPAPRPSQQDGTDKRRTYRKENQPQRDQSLRLDRMVRVTRFDLLTFDPRYRPTPVLVVRRLHRFEGGVRRRVPVNTIIFRRTAQSGFFCE